MKSLQYIKLPAKHLAGLLFGLLFLFICHTNTSAQTFNEVQPLDFGYFMTSGNGGTLIINHDTGIATKSGSVIIVSDQTMGIYDCTIVGAKLVHLTYDNTVTLSGYGATAGKNLNLNYNDNAVSSHNFTLTNGYVKINFGGTLSVGKLANNPVGSYRGVFIVSYTVTY